MELRQRIGETFVVIVAALVLVGLFNATQFTIDAFQFEVKLELSNRGLTEIVIPPLGSISVSTHKTPIRIQFTLESINLELLSGILETGKGQQELLAMFQSTGAELLRNYVIKLLLLAFLGGMAGTLLLGFTGVWACFRAGLIGLSMMVLLLVGTYSTYQVDRFNSPQFNGALQAAPWVISFAEEALTRVEDLGNQIQVISGNYDYLFEQIEALEPLGSVSGDVRILHVSDIHNNPVALELISRTVENFDVNYVIDTGDLSDYGTALEGLLTGGLAELPVPYLFVPGNHDSPATVETLQKH
ncbi:MAG: metallophosphoesterase, partial [Clostridia bacterium]|nr:metallophosphoesterase [Clostridia bacterium]